MVHTMVRLVHGSLEVLHRRKPCTCLTWVLWGYSEDDVTTPAPPSPVTPPSSPEKPGKPFLSLQAPEKPVEKPVRPQEKLANGQAQKVLPPIVTFDAFQSLQVLDLISCGRQLPKARWQGSRNLQLLRPSAGHRGTKSATKGPIHPKQQHWQLLHQKLPSRRDTLPAFSPPLPRPSTSSEVRKVPSPQQAQQKAAPAFQAEDDEKDSWS